MILILFFAAAVAAVVTADTRFSALIYEAISL